MRQPRAARRRTEESKDGTGSLSSSYSTFSTGFGDWNAALEELRRTDKTERSIVVEGEEKDKKNEKEGDKKDDEGDAEARASSDLPKRRSTIRIRIAEHSTMSPIIEASNERLSIRESLERPAPPQGGLLPLNRQEDADASSYSMSRDEQVEEGRRADNDGAKLANYNNHTRSGEGDASGQNDASSMSNSIGQGADTKENEQRQSREEEEEEEEEEEANGQNPERIGEAAEVSLFSSRTPSSVLMPSVSRTQSGQSTHASPPLSRIQSTLVSPPLSRHQSEYSNASSVGSSAACSSLFRKSSGKTSFSSGLSKKRMTPSSNRREDIFDLDSVFSEEEEEEGSEDSKQEKLTRAPSSLMELVLSRNRIKRPSPIDSPLRRNKGCHVPKHESISDLDSVATSTYKMQTQMTFFKLLTNASVPS
eukprot:jgi/Bigna1/126120/aug1.2_g828